MKTAVIGTGKTGGVVLDLLNDEQIVGPFNTANKPTVEALQQADVCVIFVPGSAVDTILEAILDSRVPAVWGSTGYDWPVEKIEKRLQNDENKWLRAANFSLGMQIVRRCLNIIGEGAASLNRPEFSIHEIHHTGKKDAPSGTALSWKEWLGRNAEITSERKGDIKGIHRLEMKTPFEDVTLKHKAKDRAVFAEGALWAAEQLLDDAMQPGFYTMEEIFDRNLTTETQNTRK